VNLLALRGLTGVDPAMQTHPGAGAHSATRSTTPMSATAATRAATASTSATTSCNDNVTGKIDYNISTRHAVSGLTRTIATTPTGPTLRKQLWLVPAVTNPTHADLVALSWRWTPSGPADQRSPRRLQSHLRVLPQRAGQLAPTI
jgi:hypothetical protein